MSVDILGTSWDQCRSMVQYSFTSTETRRLVRTDSPGRPPRLSHSSWTMSLEQFLLPRYNLHGWLDIKNQTAVILSICNNLWLRMYWWCCLLCADTDEIIGLILGWFFVDRNESMTICGLTVTLTVTLFWSVVLSVVRMLTDEYVGSNTD